MTNDPRSPHTPSPLPADADATVTGTDIVYLAGLQPQPVEWLWQHRLAAGTLAMLSGKPGSGKTWAALATLRPAKFDIGVRSSKDAKSGAWWWALPLRRMITRRFNQARCSNKLLEHLEHLRETNDLFGNLAKSQYEGKWMSLLLKVVAEGIDPDAGQLNPFVIPQPGTGFPLQPPASSMSLWT
jgi:hypothetical protein